MERKIVSTSKFKCNARPESLAERIADTLQWLAALIDGRWHLAIDYETNEMVTASQFEACIKHGLNMAELALHEVVAQEGRDRAMRVFLPKLFDDEKH